MKSFHIFTKLKAVIRTLFFACMISNFFNEAGFAIDEFSELKTVAEKSDFTATSKHSEVIEFQNQLAKMSSIVSNREIGANGERGDRCRRPSLQSPHTTLEALPSRVWSYYCWGTFTRENVPVKKDY
ncbi:hypothetical protein N8639_01495 [bacterium]|nr:hypothetical protein [bacterium]